ncbi:hypothetical protein H4R19_002824 [Coemansia spiralis]|nr:hypothetical protein H4R19_002824 [Coemansia spiralis]
MSRAANNSDGRAAELRARLGRLRAEELEIEAQLCALEDTLPPARSQQDRLSRDEIGRYSRQLLLPEVGTGGQLRLRNSAVLVVGTGGLGSPCALYLAAMGVGTLGLVDHDTVDHSNLHRQIAHTTAACESAARKVVSAHAALARLNPQCRVRTHDLLLDSTNALDTLRGYDIVVDATDNAATRYLVNDACVLLGVPLVSGSAVRVDGQLTVYNYNGGPCYRCLFPAPPPADAVATCSEAGVLGVVPGIIGCLQALEVVKVLTGRKKDEAPGMLLFSYKSQPYFRAIKLRSRVPTCAVCGDAPTITELVDYVAFCGSGPSDSTPALDILDDPGQRVSCREYSAAMDRPHLLLDVRDETQFGICSLPGALNIPVGQLDGRRAELERAIRALDGAPVYAICRRGNDSQLAVQYIRSTLGYAECYDVARGLIGWQAEVDPEFPTY